MKIFFYGDDWVRHLANLLNSRPDLGISADFCEYPDVQLLKIWRKVVSADAIVRVGVRPGAPGKRLLIIDCIWWLAAKLIPQKRVIYYWIGTDVLDAVREFKAGHYPWFARQATSATHFSNAPWLKDELEEIGLSSRLVLFPVGKVSPPPESELKWPSELTVLTYIPDGRAAFYGGPEIVAAARCLPEIRFLVVGGNGGWLQSPPKNIKFLGQVSNMSEILNQSNVVVRLVEHDAIGGTVREGLFFARHVVYSYPLPNTCHVAWKDDNGLCTVLRSFNSTLTRGALSPNLEGRAYAIAEWSPDRLLQEFARALSDT